MSCFIPGDGQLSPEPQRKPKIDDTPTHMFDVDKFEKEHTQVHGGIVSNVVGKNRMMDDGCGRVCEEKTQEETVIGDGTIILSAAVPVSQLPVS